MKKWLGIILLIAIASTVVFYTYQKLQEARIASLESIVPNEAIYYLHSYNLDKKIKEFQSSQFFQQISASPVYEKFIQPKLDRLKQKMPFISNFIEKDVAIAMLSLGNKDAITEVNIGDIGDFLILVRLDPKQHAQIKRQVADCYLFLTAKDKVSYKQYKGVRITNYKLSKPDMVVNYAFLADVFIFSNDVDIIKKSIDLYKKQSQNSLLNNEDFRKVTARVKKDALLWGYQNNQNYYQEILRRYASSSLEAGGARGVQAAEALIKMKPLINLMNVFKGHVFYLDYDELKEGLVVKSRSTFGSSVDEYGILKVIAYNKSVDKNTFNLIPKNIIGYYGGSQNLLDTWKLLKKFYSSIIEIMKADMGAGPHYYSYRGKMDEMSLENALKSLESFLGVNIEKDILPLLGNNFGEVFVNIDDLDIPLIGPSITSRLPQQQNIPFVFPQIYAFCELKDSSKMQKVMETVVQSFVDSINQKIKEQKRKRKEQLNLQKPQPQLEGNQENIEQQAIEEKNPLTLKADSYKDIDIYCIELLDFPVDLFKPNYCILDNYIIFSLSPKATENIIDIYKTKSNSFSSNFDFENAQNKIPSDYCNIIFFDFQRMIDNITRTKFFNDLEYQFMQNPSKSFSKEDLDSILNILSNISTFIFTNNLSDADAIESSLYIKIKGL